MTETKKTTAPKDPTPFVVVDLLTNEILSRHAMQHQGFDAHKGEPIDVFYRPRKRGF